MKIDITKNTLLTGSNMIIIACRMLYNINKTILTHNEHTAFLVMSLMENQEFKNPKCTKKNLLLLSLFHTLGYLSSYVNHDDQFASDQDYFSSSKETESKYIFTCHYLEHMTPIGKDAHALSTFTQDFDQMEKSVLYHTEYKSIIYLCARIADYLNKNQSLPEDLNIIAPGKLDPEYVELFKLKNKDNALVKDILKKDDDKQETPFYWNKLISFIQELTFTPEEETQLLKFLVYLLDFKSSQTLVHSINTSSYALSIGERLNLNEDQLQILFLSSILHDIGKTRSPKWILESRQKILGTERILMQAHVTHSKNILQGLVPAELLEVVYAHHEDCNGNGYPNRLSEEQIPFLAKILSVADVASSLMDMRSYKQSLDKDRTLQIILQLTTAEHKFDIGCAGTFLNFYDDIKNELPEMQKFFSVDFASILEQFNNFLFSKAHFNSDNQWQEDLEELEIVE